MRRLVAALPLAAVAFACAPRLLPGTDIQDTKETRAIASQVEAYRQAVEKLDPAGVMALTAPDYFDNSGTIAAADDVNRAGLEKRLQDLKQVEDLRFQLTLRRVDVQGDKATAEVFFDEYYRVKTPSGNVVPRHDADVHRLALRKVDGQWLFVSGL
jgi:ketosteroid isomerase-like protein